MYIRLKQRKNYLQYKFIHMTKFVDFFIYIQMGFKSSWASFSWSWTWKICIYAYLRQNVGEKIPKNMLYKGETG